MIDIIRWILLVVFVEGLTELIVESKIMNRFRMAIKQRGSLNPEDPNAFNLEIPKFSSWSFWAMVISCGYCTSVWVSMPVAFVSPDVISNGEGFGKVLLVPVNIILAIIILHRASNLLHMGFILAQKGRVKTFDVELKITSPIVFETNPIDLKVDKLIVDLTPFVVDVTKR